MDFFTSVRAFKSRSEYTCTCVWMDIRPCPKGNGGGDAAVVVVVVVADDDDEDDEDDDDDERGSKEK